MVSEDDLERREEILNWMDAVIKEKIPRDQPFEKVLKDGQWICKLINVIQPGSVKRIATKGSNFQLMENIAAFQKACKKYGVPPEEIFQTADLFEARNIKQVCLSLYCLGRIAKAKGFDGPTLGPDMSDDQKGKISSYEQSGIYTG